MVSKSLLPTPSLYGIAIGQQDSNSHPFCDINAACACVLLGRPTPNQLT